jgi:hypothetical protein
VFALFLLSAAGFVQACSSDPASPPPTKTIAVVLAPASASVQQGGSSTNAVTVTGAGGFIATPSLAITGAPAGVTSVVSTVVTSGVTSTATVTFNVSSATVPGVYPISVRASGPGAIDVSATFTLTVTAFSFTQAFSPTTLTVAQGTTGTSSVALTRSNLTGDIALTIVGAPAGVTISLSPSTTTGTSSTLTVTAAVGATLGTVNLTLTGTSAGAATQTSTLALTITAQPSTVGLTLSPALLSIAQDATGNTSVALARSNFAGSVNFTAENLPAGVTASFVPNPNTGTGTLTTLTLVTSAATPLGTTTITVRGTGTGITATTVTMALTITPGNGVVLSASPATLTVTRGTSGARNINLARSSFTVPVTLTAEGLPAGVSAAFVPGTTTGTASTMTITATAGATTGNFTITIRGTGPGMSDAAMTLVLTIN